MSLTTVTAFPIHRSAPQSPSNLGRRPPVGLGRCQRVTATNMKADEGSIGRLLAARMAKYDDLCQAGGIFFRTMRWSPKGSIVNGQRRHRHRSSGSHTRLRPQKR